MIDLLVRQQLTCGLRDRRFSVLAIVLVLLSALAGILQSAKYRSGQEEYRERSYRSWSDRGIESVRVHLPPSLSRLLTAGADGSTSAQVRPGYVDYSSAVETEHAFRVGGAELDWIFIFASMGSIIAIVFSFNLCNGARRSGLLRVCLSGTLRRSEFLVGRQLGALALISVPVLTGMLLSLVCYYALGAPDGGFFGLLRAVLAAVAVLLYLSFWVSLSLLASCVLARPASCLLVLFLLWVIATIVLPQSSFVVAGLLQPVPSPRAVAADVQKVQGSLMVTGLTEDLSSRIAGIVESSLPEAEKGARIEELSRTAEEEQEGRLAQGRKAIQGIYEDHDRAELDQIHMARMLACCSPFSLVEQALSGLAGVGDDRNACFRSACNEYDDVYTRYVQALKERYRLHASYATHAQMAYGGYLFDLQADLSYAHVQFDFSDFPRFEYKETEIGETLRGAIPRMISLLLLAVVSLVAALGVFLRMDLTG